MKLKISDKTYEREQKLLYINNYKNPVNQLGFFVFVFVYVKLNSDIYKIIQLISWLDDNDPDRDFGLQIDQSEFIQDCIDMFGVNGTEEYNYGYDDELVKKVCKQVLDEEE